MSEDPEERANGIRAYTDKTRGGGLKSGPLKLRCFLESHPADIDCIGVASTALLSTTDFFIENMGLKPCPARTALLLHKLSLP